MSADTKPSFGPQLSRREFLRLSITGICLTTLGLLPGDKTPAVVAAMEDRQAKRIKDLLLTDRLWEKIAVDVGYQISSMKPNDNVFETSGIDLKDSSIVKAYFDILSTRTSALFPNVDFPIKKINLVPAQNDVYRAFIDGRIEIPHLQERERVDVRFSNFLATLYLNTAKGYFFPPLVESGVSIVGGTLLAGDNDMLCTIGGYELYPDVKKIAVSLRNVQQDKFLVAHRCDLYGDREDPFGIAAKEILTVEYKYRERFGKAGFIRALLVEGSNWRIKQLESKESLSGANLQMDLIDFRDIAEKVFPGVTKLNTGKDRFSVFSWQ